MSAKAFADFDLKRAVNTFGLTENRNTDLFAGVDPIEPSEFLRAWLDELAPVALGVNSEKARSELIIAPMLVEAKRCAGRAVNVLPGVTFEVDRDQGLAGFCDFLIVRSPEIFYVRGPVLAVKDTALAHGISNTSSPRQPATDAPPPHLPGCRPRPHLQSYPPNRRSLTAPPLQRSVR